MLYHDVSRTNYGGPFNYKAFFKVPMDDVDFFLADLFDFRVKHNYHRLLTETSMEGNSIGTYVVDFTIKDWRDSDFVREVSQLEFFVRCVEHEVREVRRVEAPEDGVALLRLG